MTTQNEEGDLLGNKRSRKQKENLKNKRGTSEEAALSSPVCYASSHELRPEFLDYMENPSMNNLTGKETEANSKKIEDQRT